MLDFPANPQVGDVFQGRTWDGVKWASAGGSAGPEGPPGADGAPGPPGADGAPGPAGPPGAAAGDNRLINGDMRINQRGEDGYTMGVYVVDRWYWAGYSGIGGGANPIGTGICVPMQNGPPEFPYCVGINFGSFALASTDYFVFQQSIEADLIGDFAWGTPDAKPVTLSFWAMAYNYVGTYGGALSNTDGTRSYPFSYSLPDIQVWHKISITIPGDQAGAWTLTGNGFGLTVVFDAASGDGYRAPAGAWVSQSLLGALGTIRLTEGGGWLYLTGFKLETGEVATPYNRKTPNESLADCQRYYQFLSGTPNLGIQGYSEGGIAYSVTIGYTTKRIKPSATIVGSFTNNNVSTINLYAGVSTILFQVLGISAGHLDCYPVNDSSGIALDAEFY